MAPRPLLLLFAALLLHFALPLRGAAAQDTQALPDVVEKVFPAVVAISVTIPAGGSGATKPPDVPKGSPYEEFFKDYFDKKEGQQDKSAKRTRSAGSGFVIDPSGIVVTANNVLDEKAKDIVVTFADGTRLDALILGRDARTDLALLKVEPKTPLTAVHFGDSASLRLGEPVFAIANPFGLAGTITSGIVSALGRDLSSGPYDDFIQTDAGLYRGSSGCPLFNMKGEVIGVANVIVSPSGGNIGIGFAVPANLAKGVISQLRKHGRVERGWLGVQIQTVTESIAETLGLEKPAGALVAKVTENGPAAKAGVRGGDVVLAFNGREVKTMRDLPLLVAHTPPGAQAQVTIYRNRKKQELTVTLELLPAQPAEAKADSTSAPGAAGGGREPVLGLTLKELTPEARKKYGIGSDVNGVLIAGVAKDSEAERHKLAPGQVIVEVAGTKVTTPADVPSEVVHVRKSGRNSVVLLVNDGKGDLRFVTLPLQ